MRLFIAIDLDDAIRQRILRFMDGMREFAPEVGAGANRLSWHRLLPCSQISPGLLGGRGSG